MLNKSNVMALLTLAVLAAQPVGQAVAGNLVTFNVNLDVQRLCWSPEPDGGSGTEGNVVENTGQVYSELCTPDEVVNKITPVCCVYRQGGSGQCASDHVSGDDSGNTPQNPSLIFSIRTAETPKLLGTSADANFGYVGPISMAIDETKVIAAKKSPGSGDNEEIGIGPGVMNAMAGFSDSELVQRINQYLIDNPPGLWMCDLVVNRATDFSPGLGGTGSYMMGDTNAPFARTRPGTVLINRTSGPIK